ncbi:DUF4870 domain-containing protein [Archangium violaceum]|nr:DUF4870 domain-containing protein [Archangium violaceum]
MEMHQQQRADSFITGSPAPTAEERTWGMLAHLSAPVAAVLTVSTLSFLGPLLVLAFKSKESAWVEAHAKRALNFHLVVCAVVWAFLATCFLSPVGVGVALLGALFSVVAGLRANEGSVYRYPIDVKIVK